MTDTDDDWSSRAACLGLPGEWWFPGSGGLKPENRWALNICASCPVRPDCLEYALEHEQTGPAHGIFGGLTAPQRNDLQRERLTRRRFPRPTRQLASQPQPKETHHGNVH